MKLKKQIAVLLALVLFFAAVDFGFYNIFTKRYINHTSEQMQAKSIELDKYLPFDENSQIVKLGSDFKLKDNLPVIDGAAALYPVFSAFVNAVYPSDSVSFDGENFTKESALQYTNTRGAYKAVVDGDADLIFCAKPSDEQKKYAEDNGVELEYVPIGLEAFVFIVNVNNPVDNLSTEDLRDIYSGKIINWSEVGGSKKFIDPITRNKGSGSQTAMLSFMNGQKIKKNPVAVFGSPIGFSFRYYVESLVANGKVKMLSLDGVYPDKENIADKSYPIVSEIYAVYDRANSNENIKPLINWILSDEGQKIIEESGYVPLK
jgi:phosphate transport system substrate-binding protein